MPSSVEAGQTTPAPLGSVTVQVTEPVGVTPAPETVAVKIRVPPVAKPEELSLTAVPLLSVAPAGAGKRPRESAHNTVAVKVMNQLLIVVSPPSRLSQRTNPQKADNGKVPVEVERAIYGPADYGSRGT